VASWHKRAPSLHFPIDTRAIVEKTQGANAGTVSLILFNRPIVSPLTSLFITLVHKASLDGKAVADDNGIFDDANIIDQAEARKNVSQDVISLFHRYLTLDDVTGGRARSVVTPLGETFRPCCRDSD
jgi:hypothetical protein